MRARSTFLLALAGLFLTAGPLTAQDSTAQGAPAYTVQFLDRTIDLRPYFQGFPYSGFDADFEAQRLFYFHETPQGRFLMVQPLKTGRGSGTVDVELGRRLHDIDWSARNFSGMRYDSANGDMVLESDEKNDEVFNLYRVSLADGSLKKITDVPYIYGWDFSKDYARIGYIARLGAGEPYTSCLRVLDQKSGESREVLCEKQGPYRLSWSGVNWTPDGKGVVLKVNKDGHRRRGNLVYVNLTREKPTMELLLPAGVERFSLGTYEDWPAADKFYYVSDESGYANLYEFNLRARTSRPITAVTEQASFTPIEIDGRKLLLITYRRPHENEMVVVDPATKAELGRHTLDASMGTIGFDEKNHFVISRASAATPFAADEMWITLKDGKATWEFEPEIRLPASMAAAIEQCNVERVEFPTFDTDSKTGKPRLLHAFLMTPKNPRANPAERLAVITSFYGGGNFFDTRAQIFCEAGISWLSPAVRGSAGFGKEFAALNDRDLGGNEIVDLFYGARFLERKLGLAPQQIGVAGGSHGGYATMRALTFPPETNSRNESYDFGFGLSHAGFSSIVSFYDATNIPDWIILESGDPKTERDRLLDRSPLSHVARLRSPLLLTHGSNDNRVGVSESRQFYEAAKRLNKPVTYIEFEGQGHGIKGLENLVRYYKAQLDFLENVVRNNAASPRAQVP
jgi:dipeptidyl aminopeptidase/acylaminoacyl peptidase